VTSVIPAEGVVHAEHQHRVERRHRDALLPVDEYVIGAARTRPPVWNCQRASGRGIQRRSSPFDPPNTSLPAVA
jgi:hypothetical protein